MFYTPLNSKGHMEMRPWFNVLSERLKKPGIKQPLVDMASGLCCNVSILNP